MFSSSKNRSTMPVHKHHMTSTQCTPRSDFGVIIIKLFKVLKLCKIGRILSDISLELQQAQKHTATVSQLRQVISLHHSAPDAPITNRYM